MDDRLILNRGRDWSSLQTLDTEESSEESAGELSPPQANGYLEGDVHALEPHNRMVVVNGEYEKYMHSSDESSQPVSSGASQQDKHFLCDTTKLNRKDMDVFGLRPAYDQFYLVVCEHCKGVYKPQALTKHIEARHSAGGATAADPPHALGGLELKSEREELTGSLTGDGFGQQQHSQPTNNNSHNLRSLLASTSKDDLDLERLKQAGTLSAGKLLKASFRGLDSKSSSSNNSTASSSPLATLSDSNSLIKRPPPTTNTTSTVAVTVKPKLLPCKDRLYDPDKHCGVRLTDDAMPCTRSLTCKTHSLTLRRSVPGRSDSFDRLLDMHRTAKEAALRAAGVEVKPTKLQLKQQARLQKTNQLLKTDHQQPQQPPKEPLVALKDNQSIINKSSTGKPAIGGQSIQLKIHLQSPTSLACPSGSPFKKTFGQLHPVESASPGSQTTSTAPTDSFVNIKQFTFGSSQPLSKPPRPGFASMTYSPKMTYSNNNGLSAGAGAATNNYQQQQQQQQHTSIQVINTTASMHNNYQKNNGCLPAPSGPTNFVLCDLSPATISHPAKPAAVCSFNERRLSIYTQSSNFLADHGKKILSSKLYNRKKDASLSALSILCNKEQRSVGDQLKPTGLNSSTSLQLNSQSNSRTDFSSNSNSQDSFQGGGGGGRSLLKGSLQGSLLAFDRTNGVS